MKVYLRPPKHLSRAMFRVANALERHAPGWVQVVADERDAELLVHHVIGLDAVDYKPERPCAVLQYCTNTKPGDSAAAWHPLWRRAKLVFSYYDLADRMPAGANFLHGPLGIDQIFRRAQAPQNRDVLVLTSGYVNGRGQEAIQEPTQAAQFVGGTAVHLGPQPEGFTRAMKVTLAIDFMKSRITPLGDNDLTQLYNRTTWVAGLRFVEGFELGVVEGLACGARPIVFDRPDNRTWFDGLAVFVEERYDERGFCSEHLTMTLADLFRYKPAPVTEKERGRALARFHWPTIAAGFWNRLKEGL